MADTNTSTNTRQAADGSGRQKASIARMVHYIDKNGTHLPAVITAVEQSESYGPPGEVVYLHVLGMTGTTSGPLFDRISMDGLGEKRHSWHWPERVD